MPTAGVRQTECETWPDRTPSPLCTQHPDLQDSVTVSLRRIQPLGGPSWGQNTQDVPLQCPGLCPPQTLVRIYLLESSMIDGVL